MIIHDTITCQRTYLRRARRGRQVQTILAFCDGAPACRARGAGRCLSLQSIYLQSIYLQSIYLQSIYLSIYNASSEEQEQAMGPETPCSLLSPIPELTE